MNDNINNIKNLVLNIKNINEDYLKKINKAIDNIIEYKCTDEIIISQTFDMLLSLVFLDVSDIEYSYYKLIHYTKLFDKGLSDDYEKIFIDQFNVDDKDCKKLVK